MSLLRRKGLFESTKVLFLPIAAISPNPDQPRTCFSREGLEELAASIQELGVLQPLSVRRSKNGGYELISGERRLRASRMAGLTEVPCILVSVDSQGSSLLALVENLQRRDLNFVEEATALAKLIETYHLSQEEAARRIGKSQSAVANKLRLLRLPPDVLTLLRERGCTERHARALLRLEEPELQRMAARGMQFSMTLGPFTLFLPAEPASLRIHLEPARAKIVEDDPEIIGLYESIGQSFWQTGFCLGFWPCWAWD